MQIKAVKKMGPLARKEAWEGRLFVMPWVLGFVIFTAGPMIASLFLSLTDYSVFSGPHWVGFQNYIKIVTDDPLFRVSLYNTAYFVALSVPLNLVGSFLAALTLNIKVRGINLFRTLYYLPSITPVVAQTLLFGVVFSGDYGLVNATLRSLGLPVVQWFFDPQITKLVFVTMGLWGIGSYAIIFLGGLQNIPESLYDAAKIDGGGTWQCFWNITIPMITPLIFFNIVMGIISNFQIFTNAFVLTKGGPANSTLFIVLYLYNCAFKYFEMGYASALAWILFLMIFIFTIIQVSLSRKWVFYEEERS